MLALAFDANAYVQAKLAQLVATDPDTYGEWTAADVVDAIADAGMTPVSHFEDYGKDEGEAANIDMVQTVPVTQRVANDPDRDAMGENVPSNYNKPVDAPKNVTADEASAVDKPCDVADSSTVKPADPVAVPGDSNYIDVPGGGITDTNENPAVAVSETITDATGEEVTIGQYGVTQDATTDASGNTVQEVKPVDSTGVVDTEAEAIKTTTTSSDGSVTETVKVESDKGSVEKTSTDDGKGNTTEVVSGELADNSTYEASKTQTTDANGTVTTEASTSTTDKDGNAGVATESSSTVNKDGQVLSESEKTTNADGSSTETKVENTYNDDGSVTSTETKTDVNADGTSTETKTTETTSADGEQVGDKVETVTEKDAQGNITEQTTTTTTEDGAETTEDTTEEAQAEQAAEQDDGGTTAKTFTVEVDAGAVTFGGTATGDVTITGTTTLSFERDGTKAATTVATASIESLPEDVTYKGEIATLMAVADNGNSVLASSNVIVTDTELTAADLTTLDSSVGNVD